VAKLELRTLPNAVEVAVWAKPRASKSRVVGIRDGRLEVALAAPPVDGEANQELVRTLADYFGVPRRNVELTAGEGGRAKRVRIAGVDEAAVLARIPK
jgi:uncharacterized protein (TIGR00251 family)